ncbi:MAG: hypothetical protein OIF40_09845, partial [Mangrovicoccus sp.]|nr:hypothetical protein [Mangrovicoccus sp.]
MITLLSRLTRKFARPALVVAGLAGLTMPAAAEDLEDIFGATIRRQASGALAVLGMTAVPGETTSTLFLDSGQPSDESYDFQQAQIAGGFRISQGIPVYLEGLIGYNRYDPVAILGADGAERILPLKWTSV